MGAATDARANYLLPSPELLFKVHAGAFDPAPKLSAEGRASSR
jgi:hypothetical protein